MKEKLRVHFIGMSQDHHSRLKTISLAPFVLKSYVDARCREEFPGVVETKASDFFWDTTPEEIISHIDIENTDLACFSIYTWNSTELYETSRLLKEKNKNIVIALGGPEVSPGAMEVMEQFGHADIAPYTPLDGEFIAYSIVKALIEETSFDAVPSVIYRSSENSLVQTDPIIEHLDLATTVSPYSSGDITFEEDRDYIATVETSRGCPYDCGYCFWGKSKSVKFFPMDRVLRDIEVIYNNPRVKEVHFTDSDFFINKTRAKTVLETIIGQNPDVITYFEINAKNITEDLVRLAGKLKNFQFILSPQSSNPRSLEVISPHRDLPEVFTEKVKMIRDIVAEPNITAAIILGLPKDTLDDFKKTIEFCLSLEPSKINVGYPLYLLPGSRFFENRDSMGLQYTTKPICAVLETPDFPKQDMNEAVRLICWVQLFVVYFPAIREYLYTTARLDTSETPLERIEKWVGSIEQKMQYFPETLDITETVAASVKKWNEVKRAFFLRGSETEGARIIYETIYQLEKEKHGKDMVDTISLGNQVFTYLNDQHMDSFMITEYDNLTSAVDAEESKIKTVFSVFKK